METSIETMQERIQQAKKDAYNSLAHEYLQDKENIRKNYNLGLITMWEYLQQDKTLTSYFLQSIESNGLKALANYE